MSTQLPQPIAASMQAANAHDTQALLRTLTVDAVVTDEGLCAGNVKVVVGDRRTLEAMAFSQIAATIPSLQAVVPKSLLALRQTRWCSNATLQEGNAAALSGRAIHEVVVFQ